jgi:hypothetical protein
MKKIRLLTPSQRDHAIETIRGIPLDGSVQVVFRETSKRSLEQNAKMWAMLKSFSSQLVWQGFKMSPEEYKDFFTAGLKKFKIVPDMHMSGFVSVGGHTSIMTVKEMSELIELMSAFGAEHGVKLSAQQEE